MMSFGKEIKLEDILSKALKERLKGYNIVPDTIGMSPARVYRLDPSGPSSGGHTAFRVAADKALYLKISHEIFNGTTYDVGRERAVLEWLEGKLTCPRVLYFEVYQQFNFLVMSEMPGQLLMTVAANHQEHAAQVIQYYAQAIKALQTIPIETCPHISDVRVRLRELDYLMAHDLAAIDDFEQGNTPFQTPDQLIHHLKTHSISLEQTDNKNSGSAGLVFSHGDLCDSNLFIKDKRFYGLIDWARGGIADPWQDISFCVRSIREDLAADNQEAQDLINYFFSLLDLSPDWNRIDYYLYMDELF